MVFALFPGIQLHWTLRKTIILFVESLLVPNHHGGSWGEKPIVLRSACPNAVFKLVPSVSNILEMQTIRPILCLLNQTLKRKAQKSIIYQAFLLVLTHHEARGTPSYTNANWISAAPSSHVLICTHASTTAVSTCTLLHNLFDWFGFSIQGFSV